MSKRIKQSRKFALVILLIILFGAPVKGESWKFLVYGDSRGRGIDTNSLTDQINTTILNELVVATIKEKPEFVLFTGDLVNKGNVHTLEMWMNLVAPISDAGIGMYPTFGNHDDDGGDPTAFTNVFAASLPANGPVGEKYRTYTFQHQNVLVLSVDSYKNNACINTKWMDTVLAINKLPHVFVFSHKPAFATDGDRHEGIDCYGKRMPERDAFWQSLQRGGVRAFFAGHIHSYDHARIDNGDGNPATDVHQYVVGTAGAGLSSSEVYTTYVGSWLIQRVKHAKKYGYLVVEIDGNNVTITWKHRTAAGVYEATNDVFKYAVPSRFTGK